MRTRPRRPSAYIRSVAERLKRELPWIGRYQPMPIEPILFNPDNASDDPDFRWFDCPNYDKCLNVAAVGNWISFTCAGCKVIVLKTLLEDMGKKEGQVENRTPS